MRVIKPGLKPTSDTWRARTTCYVCRAELEFGLVDIATSNSEKEAHIKCPECGYRIDVRVPPLDFMNGH